MPADLDLEREFADIIETLREDRMEVDPFFVRELDARVAAGFPRERRRRFTLGKLAAPALVVSTLVAGVVGLSQLDSGGDMESAGGGSAAQISEAPETVGDEQLERDASALSEPQPSGGAAATSPPVGGGGSPRSDGRTARKVERNASLVLGARPGGVQAVVDRLVKIPPSHGGFVQSSSVDVIEGGGGAQLDLRVRSDRLDAALADIGRLGEVRETRKAEQDITGQFVSARSRLADARAERKGLLRQLERAEDEATRARVKAQLRAVDARIAAAKTALSRVGNRAAYSTILVTVVGDPAAGATVDDGRWTPGDAFRDAIRVLEVSAGVLLIALAIGVPIALLALLAVIAGRLAQRRRRERLLDAV